MEHLKNEEKLKKEKKELKEKLNKIIEGFEIDSSKDCSIATREKLKIRSKIRKGRAKFVEKMKIVYLVVCVLAFVVLLFQGCSYLRFSESFVRAWIFSLVIGIGVYIISYLFYSKFLIKDIKVLAINRDKEIKEVDKKVKKLKKENQIYKIEDEINKLNEKIEKEEKQSTIDGIFWAIGKIATGLSNTLFYTGDIPSKKVDDSKKYTIEHYAGTHYVKDEFGNLVDIAKPNIDNSYTDSKGNTYYEKKD